MSKMLEGNIQKKAHSEVAYNERMEEELKMCMPEFNKDAHHYFMTNFGYIKHPSKGKQLYVPYQYQIELIENFHNYRFNINMLGRQMGKCVCGDTTITLKNKTTGEVINMNLNEFHKLIGKRNEV